MDRQAVIKVDVISSPNCGKCVAARDELKAVAAEVARDALEWRDISVLDELDYAVSLGVLTLPAVAINGELVFSSLPTAAQLRAELIKRAR